MPKPSTVWIDRSGTSTATNENAGHFLLLENGGHILLETGFDILLEDSTITVKTPTSWSTNSKPSTAWEMRDGYSSPEAVDYTRITEQGDRRVTEQGDIRVSESTVFSPKNPTIWSEL